MPIAGIARRSAKVASIEMAGRAHQLKAARKINARVGAGILRPIMPIAAIVRRSAILMNIAMRAHARKPIAACWINATAGAGIL